MKFIIFIITIVSISFEASGQIRDCNTLHVGKFKLKSETGSTFITRSAKKQVEENADIGVVAIYNVKWINECTYELRLEKIIQGDSTIVGKKTDVITVHIKKITSSSYTVVTTSNFTNKELEREIEIL